MLNLPKSGVFGMLYMDKRDLCKALVSCTQAEEICRALECIGRYLEAMAWNSKNPIKFFFNFYFLFI